MGVTVLFYKLFQFKDDLAAILKRYCCHSNITHKFILSKIRLLTCSLIQIDLLNYSKELSLVRNVPLVRNISLHMPFKMCVLLRGKPAVSPMSGAPTFDIEKKQKRGEFKGGVLHMIIFLRYCRNCFDEAFIKLSTDYVIIMNHFCAQE